MKAILSVVIVAAVTGLVGARYYCAAGPAGPTSARCRSRRGDLSIKFTATGTRRAGGDDRRRRADRRQHQELGPRPGPAGQDDGLPLAREGGSVLAQLDDSAPPGRSGQGPRQPQAGRGRVEPFPGAAKADGARFERAKQLRDTDSAAEFENALAETEIAKADLAMSDAKVEQAKIALNTGRDQPGLYDHHRRPSTAW